MATKLPYVAHPKLMTRILEKIKEAKTPDRFTHDFLATKLKFSGGNYRQFIPLAKKLGVPREYVSLTEWKEWAQGASYLQANKQEVASMLGFPQRLPAETEIIYFGQTAFETGVKAVFVTLGEEGAIVMTPSGSKKIAQALAKNIVDTTGCGDVFCGGTAAKLIEGKDPFEAASFGLELATEAASLKGIEETYEFALIKKRIENL